MAYKSTFTDFDKEPEGHGLSSSSKKAKHKALKKRTNTQREKMYTHLDKMSVINKGKGMTHPDFKE